MKRLLYWLTRGNEIKCHSFCPTCWFFEECSGLKCEKGESREVCEETKSVVTEAIEGNKKQREQKSEDLGSLKAESSQKVLNSISITERTKNPEVFFRNYKFAVESSFILSQQNGNIMIGEYSAQEVLIMLLEERDDRIIDFISRCYWENFGALVAYVEKNHPKMGEDAKEYYDGEYESWLEDKEEEMRMLEEERKEAARKRARIGACAYAASHPWE